MREICYLCGKTIEKGQLSDDHVPPKAFYPEDIRAGLNLQTAPTHKDCNEDYREDEEYFQHVLYMEVLKQRPPIISHLEKDFSRRAEKPQTPAMIRKILKGVSNITPGGIYLPKGIFQVELDEFRIQRVVLKIARGLFYLDNKSFIPLENAKDIRTFCLDENEVPDMYKLYWPVVRLNGVYPKVFSYKYFNTCKYSVSGKYPELDKLHRYSMFFWEAVMFCVTFEEP